MVGDNPQGHVLFGVVAIVYPGNLRDLLHNVLHGVHQEQVVHVLHHAGQALQSHARVDVLLHQVGVVAAAVVVKLGEHQVPHLYKAVAVAAHAAGGLAAAVLLPPVEVDLRAGAAGAGAVLPEIVLFAQALHVALFHADFLGPDIPGLVVIFIDGDIQLFLGHLQHLGEELPGKGDGLPLEIIAEGEVAQHLKIGAVAVGVAHVLNVAGADALLAGGHTPPGGLHLAGEVLLHGRHAGVDEQQAVVPLGNQRKAGKAQVLLALKILQEFLSQFV